MESQELAKIVEKAKSIVGIREMLRTGQDEEGNRPSAMAYEVLKHTEAELGKLAAEWIATHSRLVLDS
jgi:hypothetical protein